MRLPASTRVPRLVIPLALALLATLLLGAVFVVWERPLLSLRSPVPAGTTVETPKERPYLGVTYVPVTERMARGHALDVTWGVLITAVSDGSPAERAGIREGDIMHAFDDQELTTEVSLIDVLWHRQPGSPVNVTVIREGKHYTLTAVLGSR